MKWAALTKPITRAGLFISDSCDVARQHARFEAGWSSLRLARHHGGGLDLHPRGFLDQSHYLDQRHRRIMRAKNLAIDPAERFQTREVFLDIDDIPGEPHQMLRPRA